MVSGGGSGVGELTNQSGLVIWEEALVEIGAKKNTEFVTCNNF